MPCSSTRTYNHWVHFYIIPTKVIFLFLVASFQFFADDVGAQINCDSDPKVIDTSTDTSNGIECSNNDDANIILERGVQIETTSNPGIHISNSENVSIKTEGDTLINTSEGNGIWVEYDPTVTGGLINIEVDYITLSRGDDNNITPFAGIRLQTSGEVKIKSSGKIATLGENMDGILVENPIGTNGGNIDISVNDIETQGIDSDGIRVTPIVGDTPFFEREIGITVKGTIKTSGELAQGIIVEFADSNIKVEINPGGRVIAENTDDNTFALALIGTEIGSDFHYNKSAEIENNGLVNGNILTEGCARFNNHGTTMSQGSIVISATGCTTIGIDTGFFNFGSVDVGGKNEFRTTEFKGSYIQKNNGQLHIDIDWSGDDVDLLAIEGSADLEGILVVNTPAFPDLSGISLERGIDFSGQEIKSWTFFTASEGITGNLHFPSRTPVLLSTSITKSTDNT